MKAFRAASNAAPGAVSNAAPVLAPTLLIGRRRRGGVDARSEARLELECPMSQSHPALRTSASQCQSALRHRHKSSAHYDTIHRTDLLPLDELCRVEHIAPPSGQYRQLCDVCDLAVLPLLPMCVAGGSEGGGRKARAEPTSHAPTQYVRGRVEGLQGDELCKCSGCNHSPGDEVCKWSGCNRSLEMKCANGAVVTARWR